MKLEIIDMHFPTPDAVTLHFKKPAMMKAYKPGQYGIFVFGLNSETFRRSYSFHSVFHLDPELRITIRRINGGKVSSLAMNKAFSSIELKSIEGRFFVEPSPDKKRHLIMFAAGSGITPQMAMIRAILKHEPDSILTLFYSNRLYSTIIFREELMALAKDYPDKLRIHHILTRAEDTPQHFQVAHKGRLSRLVIRKMVKEVTRDTNFGTEYYLCGPYEFMSVTSEALRSLDIRNIHQEHFFVPESKDDLAFATFPPQKISLRLKDRDETILVESGKSILQAALENKLNVTYSCTEGQCGLCRASLLKGDVKLRRNYVLTSQELREGQILLCQGYPVSENVLLRPIN